MIRVVNLPVQNNLSPLTNTPSIMGTLRSMECPQNIECITSSKTFSLEVVYFKPLGGKWWIVKLVRGLKKKNNFFFHLSCSAVSLETHNSVHLRFSNPAINFYCKDDFLYTYFIHLTKYQ